LFDADLGPDEAPIAIDVAVGPLAEPPGPGLGIAMVGDRVALGTARSSGGSVLGTLGTRSVQSNGLGPYQPSLWQWPSAEPPLADVQVVDGEARLVTCAGLGVGLVVDDTRAATTVTEAVQSCFHDPEGRTFACGATQCTEWSDPGLSDPLPGPVQPMRYVRQRAEVRAEVLEGVTGLRFGTTTLATQRVLSNTPVLQGDAILVDDVWYAVAVTDPVGGPRELRLVHGPTGGPFVVSDLGDFDATRPDLEPVGATLAASDTRLLVVVSLESPTDSAVAWSALARP
ncbi:MAG: hypothetical protein AAF602_12140, partial [Myxococcota bacterium]